MSESADAVVKNLTPRAKRLLRLLATGMRLIDAAAQCAYSYNRAAMIATSTLGKDYIEMVELDVNKAIAEENATVDLDTKKAALQLVKDEVLESTERMIQLRDSSPPAVMFAATKHLMDIAGVKPQDDKAPPPQIILADQGLNEAISRLLKTVAPVAPVEPPPPTPPVESKGVA